MNRNQQAGGRIAIFTTGAAMLAMAAPVTPESSATLTLPPTTPASLAAICRTSDAGRSDPAWMRQSFENDHCSLPQEEPPVLDGTRASRDQLMAGLAAAKQFAASADRYQECISAYLVERRQDAERSGEPVDIAFVTIEMRRIVAGEASKKRVLDHITMAVDDFNAEGSGCPE